jgi:hypothetical protein
MNITFSDMPNVTSLLNIRNARANIDSFWVGKMLKEYRMELRCNSHIICGEWVTKGVESSSSNQASSSRSCPNLREMLRSTDRSFTS